jgi:hypothetical protein
VKPSIAVDAAGTGYLVYSDEPPGQTDQRSGFA